MGSKPASNQVLSIVFLKYNVQYKKNIKMW